MIRDRIAQAATAVVVGATALSPLGLSEIQRHEGTVNRAYADPAHGWTVPTICSGHTKTAKRGMWLSDAQCLDLLKSDADAATKDVLRLVKVPLSQGELDAYVSFVFNVGAGNFGSSTALRLLNSGDRVGACLQLPRWVYANGKALPGLVKRREAEARTCLRDL